MQAQGAQAGITTQVGVGAHLPTRLRILSYNIQVGVGTRRFGDYLTHSWKHVLPHRARLLNLNRIARLVGGYDMVSLQEVDAGSLRSGFVDMTEYLAHRAGFPYWHRQINRNMGMLAQHSNGFLSRHPPERVTEYKLPRGPGRGATVFQFGGEGKQLYVCCLHLALSSWARRRQLDYVTEMVRDIDRLVIMGDLNAGCDAREVRKLMDKTGLRESSCDQATFPSWRPVRKIDHILVADSLRVVNAKVLDYPLSDHLPISVELDLG